MKPPSASFVRRINAFAIDAETGALPVVSGSPFPLDVQSDANPPNIAIDQHGKYVHAIESDPGVLTPVPGSAVTDDALERVERRQEAALLEDVHDLVGALLGVVLLE